MDLANRSAVWDKQLFKTCFGVSIMEGFLVILFTALIIPAIAIAAACALVIFLSKILARINTKKDKKITPSAPEPVVRGDRYYLDIPSALNKWVQLQGAFRDPISKKYYVVSQELKDRILEKLEKPFYKKRSIFSSHEAVNYKRLCAAAEPLGLEVFTKVGLLDLLSPTVDQYSPLSDYFKRIIWAKHVDFVVWSPRAEAVVCIIELDDSSHERPDRQDRDKFLEMILLKAGYNYMHYFTIQQKKMQIKLRSLEEDMISTAGDLREDEG